MTKACTIHLQVKWKRKSSQICEYLKVELERTDEGGVIGCYHCTICGHAVPR